MTKRTGLLVSPGRGNAEKENPIAALMMINQRRSQRINQRQSIQQRQTEKTFKEMLNNLFLVFGNEPFRQFQC